MDRYVCIHGHFYQPPRENAWLEAIEYQDSAYPYHDWNERINAECYATNASSRILNGQSQIVEIVNNYNKISFDFGPTLLAWLQLHANPVYQAILKADKESQERFSGHGSAIAQAYNHMIMPLAHHRDKITQIIWGIKDFEYRFERKPEGMWLPETAVDLATLDFMAQYGIKFTILAPRQAARVRSPNDKKWHDISGGHIDTTIPYFINLPSGRKFTLFFYNGPISRAVAFEGLLNQGEIFAQRLTGGFSRGRNRPQLLHIATDGESYGHHHFRGDMALAYALYYIESNKLAKITNYGEFLEKYPPELEVGIFENTSWSCSHGVERWRSDCGCKSGQHPKWHQRWREPMRNAFDWLRDTLAPAFENKLQNILKNPWEARNDYIDVILDRSQESREAFFSRHAARALNESEKTMVIKLMELQRHTMLMYTSCGWFFDEISGIETVQVIQYAGRVLQIAKDIFDESPEPAFMELLKKAESNISEHRNGYQIYQKFVTPATISLEKVGAHYAMSSLFEEYAGKTSIYAYDIENEIYRKEEMGRLKLAVGRICVQSKITGDSMVLCFGTMHWGDHNLSGSIRSCTGEEPQETFINEVFENFSRADFPETLSLIEKNIGTSTYSLRNMFKDEQRWILNIILDSTLTNTEGIYRQIYETNAPLLRFLKDTGTPAPLAISAAAGYVVYAMLKRAFEEEDPNIATIRSLVENAHVYGIDVDAARLEIIIRQRLERITEKLFEKPSDIILLQKVEELTNILQIFPFEVNIRKIQNITYDIMLKNYPDFLDKAAKQDEAARNWVNLFRSICDSLALNITP